MGVVRGLDGRFYEIPDEDLDRYTVPDEKVKELLRQQDEEAGPGPGPGPDPGPPGPPPPGVVRPHGGGPIVIQIFAGPNPEIGGPPPGEGGEGDDETMAQQYFGWNDWRNWRNCRRWRNGW